jgi:hypothetical protein
MHCGLALAQEAVPVTEATPDESTGAMIDITPPRTSGSATAAIAVVLFVGAILGLVLLLRAKRGRNDARPAPAAATRSADEVIQAARTREAAAATRTVFLSYRRTDQDVTGRIYDRLTAALGKDAVFKDVDAIPLGADFKAHLGEAVGKATVLLAVIGPRWLDVDPDTQQSRLADPRDFVRIEITSALERSIPVVPILVSNAAMPREKDVPDALHGLLSRMAQHVRPDPDFHPDMDRLLQGLLKILQR